MEAIKIKSKILTNLKKKLLTSSTLILIIMIGFYLRYNSAIETIVTGPLRADAGYYFMYAYNLKYKNIYSCELGDPQDLQSLT